MDESYRIPMLSDDELRAELMKYGFDPPPVTGTTRGILEKKLLSYCAPHLIQPSPFDADVSQEEDNLEDARGGVYQRQSPQFVDKPKPKIAAQHYQEKAVAAPDQKTSSLVYIVVFFFILLAILIGINVWNGDPWFSNPVDDFD